MSLPERLEELNREVGAAFERALTEMRRELSTRLRSSNDDVLRQIESFTPEVPTRFLHHEDLAPSLDHERSTSAREARATAFGDLLTSLRAIDRAGSQTDVLRALLDEGRRFSSRTALLLMRDGQLHGWEGRGWDNDAAVMGLVLSAPPGAVWSQLSDADSGAILHATEAALLASKLESAVPDSAVALPLVLRDRVAAVLYADPGNGAALDGQALQLLTVAAAHAIEVLPFRERTATSTLADLAQPGSLRSTSSAGSKAEGLTAEPAAAEPAAPMAVALSAAPVAAEPVAAPPALHQEPVTLEPAPAPHDPEPSATVPWSEVAAVPASWTEFKTEDEAAPAVAEPASPSVTSAILAPTSEPAPTDLGAPSAFLDDSLALPSRHTTEVPLPEVEEPVMETAPITEPARPRPVATPPPAESHDTVLLPRPGAAPREVMPTPWSSKTEAIEPVRDLSPISTPFDPATSSSRNPSGLYRDPATAGLEPLRSTPLNTGTPEVRPPSGVQGPGWAFATTRIVTSSSEEVAHEEARRLARLLVSEIKLYNEEQVEAGRRNRDIYERLREDIDRSRQMYEERVEPRLAKSTDYFYQELVRILAAGDSKALGI